MKIIPMKYLILLLLFPFLAFGQPCVNCPSSIKAPGFTPTSPVTGFNGYTSQVNKFDGVRPTCFTPTANTLNGVIAGINTALCDANTQIDQLNILLDGCNAIQGLIDQIFVDLDSLYNTSLNSPDSSINISLSTNYNTNVQTWTLGVNIDTIKSQIMSQLDFSCVGITTTNFDSAFQALINLTCEQVSPNPDVCKPWDLFSTATISSDLSSIGVIATPYSVGSVPSGMCLDQLQYIYQVLDSNGIVLPSGYGVINASTTLSSATSFTIPVGYIQGARTINFTTRFKKKLCSSGQFCGLSDSTITYVVPPTTYPPLVLNDDTITVKKGISLIFNCATLNVYNNDIIPGGVAISGIFSVPNTGTATFNSTTGALQWCPNPLFGSDNRSDTIPYYVEDVYGQRDTALAIFNIVSNYLIQGDITYSEFRDGASVDTIVLGININAPSGKQFAEQGALLEFDDYKTSVQLDDPAYINGNRDAISGTVIVLVDDVGSTLDTVNLTLQMVTNDYAFYEEPLSIALSTTDTLSIYNTDNTSFQYAQPGTQFCVGSATDFVQTTFSISGAGVLNADGTTYLNGVCIDSVVATARIDTGAGYIPKDWKVSEVIIDAGTFYKTKRINGVTTNLSATTSFATTSYVKPNSAAYTTTITTAGFEFLDYNWYVKINHQTTDWLYLKSDANNPQCSPFVGIMNLTCND